MKNTKFTILRRIEKDKTQLELSIESGIPLNRLVKFENGYIQLRPEEVQILSDILGVPAERIVGGAS